MDGAIFPICQTENWGVEGLSASPMAVPPESGVHGLSPESVTSEHNHHCYRACLELFNRDLKRGWKVKLRLRLLCLGEE